MASANPEPPKPDGATQRSSGDIASPRSNNNPKVVSIADPEVSPLMVGRHKELERGEYLDLDKAAKQYRASVSGKRLSGRPSIERLAPSGKLQSQDANPSLSSLVSDTSDPSLLHHSRREHLVSQVTAWLKNERARRAARKAKRKAASKHGTAPADSTQVGHDGEFSQGRRMSTSSDGSEALEQLANILERTMSLKSNEASPRHHRRHSQTKRLSAIMKRHPSTVSSGEDYFDSIDQLVPSCDAILDNSKTMAYGAGGPESEAAAGESGGKSAARRAKKEKEAWATFKYEIVRLARTLKLKGWRRVPLEKSSEISVERLSGALTNAVYVVSPPKNLPPLESQDDGTPVPRKPPPKLLLRIYGPQVEHLIDRDAELQILRRLARKRIGPRMLGTFTNGRFEEFFNARALTPQEMRNAETSKQIAKRMRELHEGIDLLQSEREAGPFVWQNWDKWIDRVDQVVTWLDKQIIEGTQGAVHSASDRWKDRGLVCGVEWPVFRRMVEKYRAWLDEQYGGKSKVNERLVFAHNDTQYGNILRMTPEGESPLMLPANEHKQLIVIDFEYANANLPGLEFANHFTEWAYNYHDPEAPHRCNTAFYPTTEEQHRFIRAYLMHNPSYKAPGGSASNPPTPYLGPLHTSGSSTALAACAAPTSISAFMLDSRAPPGERYSYQDQEAQAELAIEEETRRLMAETRLWRLANSVQWVAWGIVQAHVPGLPDADGDTKTAVTAEKAAELESATKEVRDTAAAEAQGEHASDGVEHGAAAEGEPADHAESQTEEEEFDYLGYAQERAMFVWGDAMRLGIIAAEELPEEVRKRVKLVEY